MTKEVRNINPTVVTDSKSEKYRVEFHSRHRKLVVRDLKTGKYAKKPNKH
jgi:hypothetical protein